MTGSPSWDSKSIELFIMFCAPTKAEMEAFGVSKLEVLVLGWLKRCNPSGVIKKIDGDLLALDDLTAREYIDSDPLDFDYLSTVD